MQFPPHPGKIRMVDLAAGTSKEISSESAPEDSRFVYLDKRGVKTSNPAGAVERIPIVLVEMMAVDDNGNLVPDRLATKIHINEFGPGRRPLRSTIMVPDKK